MIKKPYAAFGRVLYSNTCEAGYTADTATHAGNKTVLLFTEGSFTTRDKQSGEVVHECGPGWFFNGEYQDQVLACTANTESVSWCYDPKINQDYVPIIELLSVASGQSSPLAKNTNLFLCSGTLQINGENFVAPRQISVRSDDVTANAVTTVYGLIFK